MKKTLLTAILLISVVATTFIACKKLDNGTTTKNATTSLVSQTNTLIHNIGHVHNQAMEAAIDTTQFDFTSDTKFLNSVSNFVNSYLETNAPELASSSISQVYAPFISPPPLKNELEKLTTHWNKMYDSGEMSANELYILNDIKSLVSANLNNELSNRDFQSEITKLTQGNSSTSSVLIHAVLDIANSSCRYWIDEGYLETQAAHWVALDAAGALVGATIQAVKGGDGKAIVEGAVIGAVSGSLRLVGTIAKGIGRWLRL